MGARTPIEHREDVTGSAEWVHVRMRDASRGLRPSARWVRADATVGDLASSLGWGDSHGLEIDGRLRRFADRLDEVGFCEASTVRPQRGGEVPAQPTRCWAALVVRDGLDAGRRLELHSGQYLIGRSAACDLVIDEPDVELLHVAIQVGEDGAIAATPFAEQPGSRHEEPGSARIAAGKATRHDGSKPAAPGTTAVATGEASPLRIGEWLQVGSLRLQVEGDLDVDRSRLDPCADRTARATLMFNRPPRPRPAALPATPVAPNPEVVARTHSLALATIVVPVLLAAVLVAVTGTWLFALLTALSPILATSSWYSSRRRHASDTAAAAQRFVAAVADYELRLDELRRAHERLLDARCVDLAEVARRVQLPSVRLWERRLGDHDALRVRVGVAAQGWRPPSGGERSDAASLEVPEAVAAVHGRVGVPTARPVELHLGEHNVVGVVGDRAAALALARSIVVQLAAHHGPADLATVAVLAEPSQASWSWLDWLPHRLGLRADGPSEPTALLSFLVAGRRDRAQPAGSVPTVGVDRHLLLVVDDEAALTERSSPVRAALRGEAGPLVGVVVAASADRLPATCRAVLDVRADGIARLTMLDQPHVDGTEVIGSIDAMGASLATAEALGAALARYEDTDVDQPEASLPGHVGLIELLASAGGLDRGPSAGDDLHERLVEALVRSWEGSDGERTPAAAAGAANPSGLAVPIGRGAHGALLVDLVADGPHALVAGTTGAGKSELLRSWIAAMATVSSPARLNFVLIDFKGGSAFDACGELPHTAAVVTDLDEQLAARVLQSLYAELAYRERVLRSAGVADVAELGATVELRTANHLAGLIDRSDVGAAAGPGGAGASTVVPAPARLVVVIDEFATLAAELPDFLDALVGIAQRGRSLGVHLVLATQRPSGVVNDQIRANTNIRIALRVQDRSDAVDVVDRPEPVDIGRQWPGRAYVRLGRDEVTLVQTGYSGTISDVDPTVTVLHGEQRPGGRWRGAGSTDLQRVVRAAAEAAARLALPAPRVPWPEPLPTRLQPAVLERCAAESAAAEGRRSEELVPFLLADEPANQRRSVEGWRPAQGNLLVFGTTGSGVTGSLVSVTVAAAERSPADQLHVHVVGDDPGLEVLAGLAHVGTVVRQGDRERRLRLLHRIDAELARRRHGADLDASSLRRILLVVDGLGSMLSELAGDAAGGGEADRLCRIIVDGPAQGIYTVAGVEHASALRHAVLSNVSQRVVLRLADGLEARQLGVTPSVGPAGRGRLAGSDAAVQVVDPVAMAARVAAVARRWPAPAPARAPWRIGRLPQRLSTEALSSWRSPSPTGPATHTIRSGTAQVVSEVDGCADEPALWLPVGVGGVELAVQGWLLRAGDGVLVAGPARSGRSSVLCATAQSIRRAVPVAQLLALAPRRSPLLGADGVRPVRPEELAKVLAHAKPRGWRFLLVDDADAVADEDGSMSAGVASALAAGWVVIAAARSDALRAQFGHWTRAVRSGRTGLLLDVDVDLDGDLLGVRLPRSTEAPIRGEGRGLLVADGQVKLVQCAVPAEPTAARPNRMPRRP